MICVSKNRNLPGLVGYLENEMSQLSLTIQNIKLMISFTYYPGDIGRGGPSILPEDSYPPIPAEVDIIWVSTRDGIDIVNDQDIAGLLSESTLDEIVIHILKEADKPC